MAIATKDRRVLLVGTPESPRGTAISLTGANDAIPTIRSAVPKLTPFSVERPTLRLSLTKLPDTYPGVAELEIKTIVELGGLPTNPQTDYAMPIWADLMRACGFDELSSVSSGATEKPRLLQNVTSLTGGTAGSPMRHGEVVTGNGGTIAGAGIVVGDFYAEDDVLCVLETTAPTGTALTTWTGATSARVATGTRSANSVGAWILQSNVNSSDTATMQLYCDGKRYSGKGFMGNAEFLFDHGDYLRAEFTMRGVARLQTDSPPGYGDATINSLGTINEQHKLPAVFLGKEVRFYETTASPKGYGRDAAGFANVSGTPTISGAITTIRVNTGNNVTLRPNSFDPNGVSFALITGRAPTGTFNPDEVASADFDWITKFILGNPIRFKAMMGAAGTVTTQDGGTVDVIAPGIVISNMGDADREGINTWDGSFKLSGGDYDPSAAGEAPGNDNELTIIYR